MIVVLLPVRSGLLLSLKSAEEQRPKETIIQMSSVFRLMDTATHNRDKDFDRKVEDDGREERLKRNLRGDKGRRCDGRCVWCSVE